MIVPGSTFSICTLYRNPVQFEKLTSSLERNGFLKQAELLSINNLENTWDCYQAIRHFLKVATGEYIVICHEDVDFRNLTLPQLDSILTECTISDSRSAVFGVAGIARFSGRGSGHFYSKSGEENWGFSDEGRVLTLDECFLIIRKSSGVNVSKELSGFHFYGTDLCLNAEKIGRTCYVIDYPVLHESIGKLNEDFYLARDRFGSHLKKNGQHTFLSTTCTELYGGSGLLLEAWALARSLSKIKFYRNNNYEESFFEIDKRGREKIGRLFPALIRIADIEILLKTLPDSTRRFYWNWIHDRLKPIQKIFWDINWWRRNWKSRL